MFSQYGYYDPYNTSDAMGQATGAPCDPMLDENCFTDEPTALTQDQRKQVLTCSDRPEDIASGIPRCSQQSQPPAQDTFTTIIGGLTSLAQNAPSLLKAGIDLKNMISGNQPAVNSNSLTQQDALNAQLQAQLAASQQAASQAALVQQQSMAILAQRVQQQQNPIITQTVQQQQATQSADDKKFYRRLAIGGAVGAGVIGLVVLTRRRN